LELRPAGRILRFVNPDDTVDYDYDGLGQLETVDYIGDHQTDESYLYDDNSNREAQDNGNGSRVYDAAGPQNRLTDDGYWTYVYDNEGNLIEQFHVDSGLETISYTWDHKNRLTRYVHKYENSGTTELNNDITYTYDVFDRRIGKTRWDSDGVAYYYSASSVLVKRS